jgi:transcriptional regulator
MYVPDDFACDEATARALTEAHPFALVVVPDLDAAHVPLVWRDPRTLVGHVAHGSPLAFVSPRWYVSARQVPTWNYEAVHVHGRLEAITDLEGATDVLRRLSRTFDPEWDPEAMLGARAPGLMRGIVAFALRVERITGKRKLGQNRADADRIAAGQVLARAERETERAIGAAMLAVPARSDR